MKPKIIVFTVIGIAALVVALVIVPKFSQTPAYGPGFGPGMRSSGHAPGGLVAVSADGKALPTDPNSQLPENTAAQKVGDLNVSIALSP